MPPGARPRPHRAYARSDHAYQARTWRISTLYLAAAVRDNGAGQAIATELSAVKARACADRSSQRGTEAARELGATFIHIDPTDDYSVEAAAARVRNEYRHLDVLINNAGTAAPRLGAEELTTDTEAPVRRACHCAEGDVLDTRGFIDLFAEDGEFTGIGGPSGPESHRGEHPGDVVVFMGKFLPGVHRELHRVSAPGDVATVELSIRGTFLGPFETPAGVIEPTGARLDIPTVGFWYVRDGKMQEFSCHIGVAAMFAQPGVLPDFTSALAASAPAR